MLRAQYLSGRAGMVCEEGREMGTRAPHRGVGEAIIIVL